MKQARYELIEHTADIAVKAYGQDLPDAFVSAAAALVEIMTGGGEIIGRRPLTVSVESVDREGLLVGFLSELIRIFDTDQVVMSDFKVELISEERLRAKCLVDDYDPDRHGQGLAVKGVSYHMLEIATNADDQSCYVQVLFDV